MLSTHRSPGDPGIQAILVPTTTHPGHSGHWFPALLLFLVRSTWMSGIPSRNKKTQMGSLGATFIQPKSGGKLGEPQCLVKGSGQGSEYSWRHRVAVWEVFVSPMP